MQFESPSGGAGVESYIDPDPSTGTDGSIVRAPAIENAQRELVYLISQAGLTPARGDLTQVKQAIAAMIAAGAVFGRNSLVNGNFDVWQRGTTFNQLGTDLCGPDRWRVQSVGGGLIDVDRSTTLPDQGSAYSCVLTVDTADASLAAGDIYAIRQPLEGFTAKRFKLGGASATALMLSFWVRSSATGTYHAALRNGARNRSCVIAYTINAVDTWEKKTLLFPGDTAGVWLYTEGVGLELVFALAAGTTYQATAGAWTASAAICGAAQTNWMAVGGRNFLLAQVQLEVGSTASFFEQRSFAQEMQDCLRYYCKTFPYDTAPAQGIGQTGSLIGKGTTTGVAEPHVAWRFPVQMRAIPTVALWNPRPGGAAGQWQVGPLGDGSNARAHAPGTGGVTIDQASTTATADLQAYIHATADAEL